MAKVDGARFVHDGRLYGYLVVTEEQAALAELMPAELTPAEREVAHLVARGLTNLDIAQQRGTSVYTVGNQLAAIYEKLGVTSRHQLVARLSRGGHDDPQAKGGVPRPSGRL